MSAVPWRVVLDVPLAGKLGTPVHDVIAWAQEALGPTQLAADHREHMHVFTLAWTAATRQQARTRAAQLMRVLARHGVACETHVHAEHVGVWLRTPRGDVTDTTLPAGRTLPVRRVLFGGS